MDYPWVLSASVKEKHITITVHGKDHQFTADEAEVFAKEMLLMVEDVRLGRERIKEEIREYVKKHEGYDPYPETT